MKANSYTKRWKKSESKGEKRKLRDATTVGSGA